MFLKPKSVPQESFKARTGATDDQINFESDPHILCSVYDVKSRRTVSPPFVSENEDVAKREFSNLVNAPGNRYSANPHDYVLQLLGSIIPKTSKITACDPTNLCTGTDVLNPGGLNGRPQ